LAGASSGASDVTDGVSDNPLPIAQENIKLRPRATWMGIDVWPSALHE
jgi:hypothetical protein